MTNFWDKLSIELTNIKIFIFCNKNLGNGFFQNAIPKAIFDFRRVIKKKVLKKMI